MALISVILSLLFERYLGGLREFRNYRWFQNFTDRTRELVPELVKRPFLGVIVLLILPALAVALVYGALDGIWFPFGFAFAFAVLLYAYGTQDLEAQIESFIDARLRNDDEAARWHLAAVLGRIPEDPQQLTRSLMETVFIQLNDRLFGVIFWFALVGPAGALTFRLAALLKDRYRDDDNGFGAAANWVYYALAWLPARITAFSYAIAGSFVEAMQYRREQAHKWQDANQGILVASGLGALQYSLPTEDTAPSRESEIADLRAALSLVRRTIFVWLGLLAIVGLLGALVSLQLESPA